MVILFLNNTIAWWQSKGVFEQSTPICYNIYCAWFTRTKSEGARLCRSSIYKISKVLQIIQRAFGGPLQNRTNNPSDNHIQNTKQVHCSTSITRYTAVSRGRRNNVDSDHHQVSKNYGGGPSSSRREAAADHHDDDATEEEEKAATSNDDGSVDNTICSLLSPL